MTSKSIPQSQPGAPVQGRPLDEWQALQLEREIDDSPPWTVT